MLTNRYRTMTNGFRFRIERLSIDLDGQYEALIDMLNRPENRFKFGRFRRLIVKLFLMPLYLPYANTEWLMGREVTDEPKRVSWLGREYPVKEFDSAMEAYQWVKKQDPEAEIQEGPFRPLF